VAHNGRVQVGRAASLLAKRLNMIGRVQVGKAANLLAKRLNMIGSYL